MLHLTHTQMVKLLCETLYSVRLFDKVPGLTVCRPRHVNNPNVTLLCVCVVCVCDENTPGR